MMTQQVYKDIYNSNIIYMLIRGGLTPIRLCTNVTTNKVYARFEVNDIFCSLMSEWTGREWKAL